jgi:hypothetical protein
MPSTSKKQRNFMAAAAHNPAFAKKVGIPVSVAKEFNQADKGKKFGVGGGVGIVHGGKGQINKQITRAGSIYGQQKEVPNINLNSYIGKKEGGMAKDTESKSEMKKEMAADKKQDVAMIKKAFKEHDAQEHKGGKGTKISLKKGGMAMKETMGPRNMSKDVEAGSNKLTKFGQSAVQKRGMTKGTNLGDSGPTMGMMGGAGMKSGGMCGGGKAMKKMSSGGSASSRADGIASKGKTKGRIC